MINTDNAEMVLRNLRNVQAKYSDRFTPTGSINISSMARDAADVIEELLSAVKGQNEHFLDDYSTGYRAKER